MEDDRGEESGFRWEERRQKILSGKNDGLRKKEARITLTALSPASTIPTSHKMKKKNSR